ncbi:hypothetical protein NMG60_11004293 [Bertholletia excelsa]
MFNWHGWNRRTRHLTEFINSKSGEDLHMDSEPPAAPVAEEVDPLANTSENGSHPSKKNPGKLPKRIQKSEREKMKREHLNELFLALADALGVSSQNHGKASILGETTRVLKEIHSQIESLKTENEALMSESQYVSVEKKELQDENFALEAEIGKLRVELEEKVVQSKPDLNAPPPEEPVLQQPPYVSPFYVIPVCSDVQACAEHDATQLVPKPTSNVSKPHARYPTPSDSWPTQLLGKQPEPSEQFRNSGSGKGDVAVENWA